MSARLSPYQFSILKCMDQGPIQFEKAVEFNQTMFFSLIKRELIALNLTKETFGRTKEGDRAYDLYAHGDLGAMLVQNNPEWRREKVGHKLTSGFRRNRKKTAA